MGISRANSTIWKSGNGALTLTLKSLRIFVMDPYVSLRTTAGDTAIIPVITDGIYRFNVTPGQVDVLLTQPTADRPPYLKITVGAIFHPGAPDRRWGWAYRLERNGATIPCVHDHRRTVTVDAQGFLRRDPRTFDVKNVSGEFDYITLA